MIGPAQPHIITFIIIRMPSITSIEESYNSASRKVATTVSAKLNATHRAKVRLDDTVCARDSPHHARSRLTPALAPPPSRLVQVNPSAAKVDISGKQWSVAHNTGSQDFTFRYWTTTSELPLGVGKCKLNVTQSVPKGNWALVPNPVVKLTKTGDFLGKNNVVWLERDMMARRSSASATLYAGGDDDDKRYKLKLSGKDVDMINSLEGVARAKLWKRSLLHSVKVTAGVGKQTIGVKSRIRLFEDDEAKQTQKLKSLLTVENAKGDVKLGWSVSHAMDVADVKCASKVKTTVDVKVPLTGAGSASVVAGVKLDCV